MPEATPRLDLDLRTRDVQDLTGADAVTAFFGRLGYRTDARIEQTAAHLGMVAEGTVRPIRRIERLANQEDLLQVYLFELTSVTVAHTRALARAFRNRAGNFLLVLTSDYERVDFVCLERYLPEEPASPAPTPRQPQAGVRPRTLTIDRRKPTAVELRVLRRFTWTEADPLAQHQKILDAYTIADWSEELFNNRALFSDHYLKTRFRERPEWREDPKPAFRELRELFRGAGGRFAGKEVGSLRNDLLLPALLTLGFAMEADSRPRETLGEPLLSHGGGEELGRFLAYPWGRSLDAKDPARDPVSPEINPGAMIVALLDREEVPWAVLTNGKVWRLYSGRAHSRATNYYEVDLEEILSGTSPLAGDPGESFRYFWLLYRRQAFEPQEVQRAGRRLQECLLDQLLNESEIYAKELGDRLKDKVFEEVFLLLARGLYTSQDRQAEEPSRGDLDQLFRATLTLLYRLLFVLYSEARDLLPVREVRGYYGISLTQLRTAVTEAAGPALSQVEARLAGRYREDSYELYQRLSDLFAVVDRGDASVNVPAYDGGLFLSRPVPADASEEAEASRYLLTAKVPDRPLALALDRLARDEDPKSKELVSVDYKSLGVRQLGSIYEGLLEFRLQVAAEEMAIVKGKKTEEVIPLREARSKKRKILRTGRGKEANERILPAGELYLENDRRERKATGSYYTRDFVVEYIVAQAVGPLLEAKLEALRPQLRQAQDWHRKRVRMAGAKGEPPSKYESGPAVDHHWHSLVEAVFDFKVVDPAMGSGHFLVEVVDFITDRLLDFLAAFPWNPVFAHTDSLRRTILEEMDRQGITIDPRRLTDVNLVKRHVLKRCVFGVDINPMAVELAKVSLWLDCFTLGAPLSFLDHHLRCGNSLLGADVEEARGVVDPRQMLLAGSRFAGLRLATAAMALVGEMPDVTSGQLVESRAAFGRAAGAVAPFVRILDLYTSQWIGQGSKNRAAVPPIVEFLQSRQAEPLLRAEADDQVEEALEDLEPQDRRLVETGLAQAKDLRFFHWELEFPEVFYRPRPGTRQTIERRPEYGFDAVVGNPPWIRQEGLAEDKPALRALFPDTFSSTADIYVHFLARGSLVLAHGGRLGMIAPNKWFKADYAQRLRTFLNERMEPLEVIDFGHAPLFDDADTFPAILLLKKPGTAEPPEAEPATTDKGTVGFFVVDKKDLPAIDLAAYGFEHRSAVPRSRLRPEGWELLPRAMGDLMEKIRSVGVPLNEFVGSSPQYGIKTGLNEAFLIDQETRDHLVREDPGCEEIIKRFVRGEDVQRWHTPWGGEWMILLPSSQNRSWPWSGLSADAAERSFAVSFPSLHRWMKPLEVRLKKRQDQGAYWWELRSCDYYDLFVSEKIIYQEIQFHSRFALEPDGLYTNNKAFLIPPARPYLVATLNSSLIWWFLEHYIGHMKDEAYAMQAFRVERLPIAEPDPRTRDDLTHLTARAVERSTQRCQLTSEFHEHLRDHFGIDRSRGKLVKYWKLDERSLLDAVKRAGAQLGTAARQAELLREFRRSRDQMRKLLREISHLEIELHHRVFELYQLTPEDVQLMRETAPPRDPLSLAKQQLAELERLEAEEA